MPHGKLKLFCYYYMFAVMHELAHIMTSFILGVEVKEITLLPVGVNARYEGNISKVKEFVISLAGPLASFLFAILLQDKLHTIMNLSIAIFNLIPIYPMDGGKILRSVIYFILMKKAKNKKSFEEGNPMSMQNAKKDLAVELAKMRARKISNQVTKFWMILMILLSLAFAAFAKNYFFAVLSAYIYYIAKDELKKEKFFEIFNYLQKEE